MSCPSWQGHRNGSSWFPVQTLLVAPLWCDLGIFPNSRGNKAVQTSALDTLALLPSVKRQVFCIGDRLKMDKHKAWATMIVEPKSGGHQPQKDR